MIKIAERLMTFWTEPIRPLIAFQVSRSFLSGVSYFRKEKSIASHVILPLASGLVEPSFDKTNIGNPAAFDKAVRDAAGKLRGRGTAVSLLLPETCLRIFVLAFDDLPASAKDQEAVLRWRLNKLVPFKAEDLRLSFDVLTSGGQDRIICALAHAGVVGEYEKAFGRAGLKVRAIGIPALNLLSLIKRGPSRNILVVNVEEDYISLLAALDADIALYRLKPFHQDASGPSAGRVEWSGVVTEIQNTIHFIEDREKIKVEAIWVRVALPGAGQDGLAVLKASLPVPVGSVEIVQPRLAGVFDRRLLSPLAGQVS